MTALPTFKLYHYPATRSTRVRWLLCELLDDAFELEVVPLYEGAQYRPEYMVKNPNHNVPTLEITFPDGRSMFMIESGAMVSYLADAFPERGLAPQPGALSFERADYLQMLHFGSTWMDMMLWQVRSQEHLLPDAERDPHTIARYRKKFETEAEPQLVTRLEKTAFICGDAFTAADCIIGHDVMWARAYGLCKRPAFDGYLSRITSRPAFGKAFSDAHQLKLEVPAERRNARVFTG